MASVPFTQEFGLAGPMNRFNGYSDAFCVVYWVVMWLGVEGRREMHYQIDSTKAPQVEMSHLL